ncbi:MAG TPA: DUF47 family protein [Acidimicrobiales bacterium]|nr:DUF47 family protein [Acidimicrobiales bacterium]
MRWRQWFLRDSPDVLGLLVAQGRVTVEALESFDRWAAGDAGEARHVRALEHSGDTARRAVVAALRRAFMTPVEPEDLFELSELIDSILNQAKNIVREAEVLGMAPDEPMAAMSHLALVGMQQLVLALPNLSTRPDTATDAADVAIRQQRRMEREYRVAMSKLLEAHDLREVMGRRELYRRYARMGEGIEEVADRIWYTVVKRA